MSTKNPIKYFSTAIFCFILLCLPAEFISGAPGLRNEDRIRLAAAFELNNQLKDNIWEGWSKVPFPVLLVTKDYEYLIGHAELARGFTFLSYDTLLDSDIYYRNRAFPVNLLATFEAVSDIPTVVIGSAEETQAKTSTKWVVKLLHEHFHQLQMTQAGYRTEVKSLNLARGDSTGMWMINYPFPYDSSALSQKIHALSLALAEALETKETADLVTKVKQYLDMREGIKKMLSRDNYNYFTFQLWQEGVAMYTEFVVAKYISGHIIPPREFSALGDYESFDSVANFTYNNILTELRTLSLQEGKRVIFYYIGAGEALLLDRVKPDWKSRYFTEKFKLERYFQ